MAISRTKKETVIEKVQNIITDAKTIVFVRFDAVTSEEANTLRSVCDDEAVGYLVAKKTLVKRAFEAAKIEGDFPVLDGEIAVAYGTDPLAPARVMGEQSKKLDGRMQIIGGIFEGAYTSQERMQSIADIPPLKTLYAQFLMVIRDPIRSCASALSQIAEKKA